MSLRGARILGAAGDCPIQSNPIRASLRSNAAGVMRLTVLAIVLGSTAVLFPGSSHDLPGIDVEVVVSLLELLSSPPSRHVSIVPAGARMAPVCCSGPLISSTHRRATSRLCSLMPMPRIQVHNPSSIDVPIGAAMKQPATLSRKTSTCMSAFKLHTRPTQVVRIPAVRFIAGKCNARDQRGYYSQNPGGSPIGRLQFPPMWRVTRSSSTHTQPRSPMAKSRSGVSFLAFRI